MHTNRKIRSVLVGAIVSATTLVGAVAATAPPAHATIDPVTFEALSNIDCHGLCLSANLKTPSPTVAAPSKAPAEPAVGTKTGITLGTVLGR